MDEKMSHGSMVCNGCMPNGCCGGNYGGHGGGHHYVLLRIALGLIIIAMVFALGVKVGEFKGLLNREFDGGRMRQNVMFQKRIAPYPTYDQLYEGAEYNMMTP